MQHLRTFISPALLLAILSLSSCEKVEYFQSEKNVHSQLTGSWQLVPIPSTKPLEEWTFNEDFVYRSVLINSIMTPVDTSTYTINTSLMKVVVVIDQFKLTLDELNGDWQVVQLNDNYLIIATDHYDSTGILEREFTRVR